METNKTCVHWVYPTHAWGKGVPYKCGKAAVVVDDNGRDLCQKHFNKYQNKINKAKLKAHANN
jgi:hypothetical protein